MTISRRKLLATAASAAPAAAIASLPAIATASPVVAAVERPFVWYHSYDGETYNESFSTMEAALKFLKSEGEGMVAECQRQDYNLDLHGSEVLEMLYGQNEERIGEGEFIECTPEQERELGYTVTAAIETWARKHNIDITAWTFGTVRNAIKADEIPTAYVPPSSK